MVIKKNAIHSDMETGTRNMTSNRFEQKLFELVDRSVIGGKTVTLIIPPSPFLLDERVFVGLGLLKVASALTVGGVNVEVLDLSGVENYQEVLAKYFGGSQESDWVGITATTPQLPKVMEIAALIRKITPKNRLVIGGPHATLVYAALKMECRSGSAGRALNSSVQLESLFDHIVVGDGEYAVFRLFDADCPKIVDGDDTSSPLFLGNGEYEDSPLPARNLIDMMSYRYTIEGAPATSLLGQLGCPFNCGFCGGRNSKSLRVVRSRSSASVVREIEALYKEYGFTGFMFYDDELNVNKHMVELMDELVRLQGRLGVRFHLRGFVRASLLTEEQVASMARAGFEWMLCGFEAANERILTNINKQTTLSQNTRAVEIAKRYGLKVKALMSIGHPGESESTVTDIRDWLTAMHVDDFDCTIVTVYPGTPYYDFSIPHHTDPGVWTYTHPQTGDSLHSYDLDYSRMADYYKGNPDGGYQSYVFTDHLSPVDIVLLRDRLEREVRQTLGIKFNVSRPAEKFEHSMGLGLPGFILRQSAQIKPC